MAKAVGKRKDTAFRGQRAPAARARRHALVRLNFSDASYNPNIVRRKKPIVVVGAGVNGSAIAMELARELRAQGSNQEVILIDMGGAPLRRPRILRNSSGGFHRITRIANAECPQFSFTATDGIIEYLKFQHAMKTGKNAGMHKLGNLLQDEFGGTKLYKANGFALTMPRVKKTAAFHGGVGSNAYLDTLRNAQSNNIKHELMNGEEFIARNPGFIIKKRDKKKTDVYYEPPCFVDDPAADNWFPTGGMLFAERCVTTHIAVFKMNGGRYLPYTDVKDAEQKVKGITLTLGDNSKIEAEKVVFAAGVQGNQFLPPQFKITAQRNVVGFFKGKEKGHPKHLSADGPNPMPSFIFYFRTKGEEADYEYGIPATKDSSGLADYFKAARENGARGDPNLKMVLPGEKEALFHFTRNLADIHHLEHMKAMVCYYSLASNSHAVWAKHPFKPDAYVVHNCDGGGFKNALGAAKPMARMILGLESNNPNINLKRDFNIANDLGKATEPVHDPNPDIDRQLAVLHSIDKRKPAQP